MTGRAISIATAAGLLLLSGTSAQALESGFYAGISAGQSDSDLGIQLEEGDQGLLTDRTTVDSKDMSFNVFGGYQFGRWIAIETAFNHLGEITGGTYPGRTRNHPMFSRRTARPR